MPHPENVQPLAPLKREPNHALFIPCSGPITKTFERPSMGEVQGFIGGYFEPIAGSHTDAGGFKRRATILVNDEGLLRGLPVNPRATRIMRAKGYVKALNRDLRGPAVVLIGWETPAT